MKKYQPSRRLRQIKKKKPIFLNRFFWYAVLILIIFGTIFYFLFFGATFQIKEIEISGNQKVLVKELENIILGQVSKEIIFQPTRSIFLINTGEIQKILLENFPRIEEAVLKREFPDKLKLTIIERTPTAVFSWGRTYFLIDKNGIIFEESPIEFRSATELLKIGLPVPEEKLRLGEKIIEEEKLSKILKLKSELEELRIPFDGLSVISEEKLDIKTKESWDIYFNLKGDINWQLTELQAVLEKQIPPEKRKNLEYIDLRFSKIYFRYRQ